MDKTFSTAIIVAVLVLILIGMYLGWQGRKKRQSAIGRPKPAPDDVGRELLSAEALYLATTVADEPLNRIVIAGLGFRAKGTVTVAERGVVLSLTGEGDAFIPVEDLRGAGQATWTIDKTVEEGGLLLIGWNLVAADNATTAVDSYLRVTRGAEQLALISAIESLLPENDDQESVL